MPIFVAHYYAAQSNGERHEDEGRNKKEDVDEKWWRLKPSLTTSSILTISLAVDCSKWGIKQGSSHQEKNTNCWVEACSFSLDIFFLPPLEKAVL